MSCTGIARPIVTGVPCGLVKKGSLSGVVVDPVQTIGHDQLLLRDSYAPHYTTAEWPGFEHLLADRKYTVGTLRTPRAGRCWLFDGNNDYGTAASNITAATWTLCVWVKASWASAAVYRRIIEIGSLQVIAGINANTNKISLYDGTSWREGATSITPSGQWVHLAWTYNGTTLKQYINGVEDYSNTAGRAISNHSLVVGSATSGSTPDFSIRDVRVYSSVKTASEILAIKNQADTPGTYDATSLLGAWWCEEESGTTGYDWSGNGRNLTLTNITQASFHAADTGVTYSDANVRGARQWKTISNNSSFGTTPERQWLSQIPLTGDFEIIFWGLTCSDYSAFHCGFQAETTKPNTSNVHTGFDLDANTNASDTLFGVGVNGSYTTHTVASYSDRANSTVRIVRSGTTASVYLNGNLVTTKTVTSSPVYATFVCSIAGNTRVLYSSGLNMEQDNAGKGSDQTLGMFIMPAVSSTLAADGNALTHTGKCPQPGYAPQKVATFDGTDDYATLGARLTSGTISSLTVSSWIYINSLAASVTIAGEYLLTGNNRSWLIQLNTSGNLSVLHSNDGTASSTASYGLGLVINTWYHLAFTVSGSTFNVYINGYLVGTGSLSYSTLYNSAANFEVGGWNASGANSFNGRMADVRVYSNTKSAAEVLAIKRGNQDTTNLLGQWPMCEGPGSGNTNTTIYDVSGNGKHLTITNATVSSFWANVSTYDSCIPNHPLKYGYTIDGSGVVVPAKLDGLFDAAGNAIGTAAGKWKSGLPNINCLPYTNPLGVNIGLETALDPTADRKTTSSSKRRRRNTTGLYDRIGARATAMSDSTSNTYFGD